MTGSHRTIPADRTTSAISARTAAEFDCAVTNAGTMDPTSRTVTTTTATGGRTSRSSTASIGAGRVAHASTSSGNPASNSDATAEYQNTPLEDQCRQLTSGRRGRPVATPWRSRSAPGHRRTGASGSGATGADVRRRPRVCDAATPHRFPRRPPPPSSDWMEGSRPMASAATAVTVWFRSCGS